MKMLRGEDPEPLKMQQKPKERGIFCKRETPKKNSKLAQTGFVTVCNRIRLLRFVKTKRFAAQNANVMVISSREHTHVLVEGASDTFCHVQTCKHEVALQQFGHDNRFSPVNDVELLECRHSCLHQLLGSLVQK